MSSPTIGVQSIRRAFAVLGALADGPLGVTRGRRRGPASRNRRPPDSSPRSPPRAPSSRSRASAATASGRDLLVARLRPRRDARDSSRPPARPSSTSPVELGEAAGLSVRDGWTVHYVDQVELRTRTPSRCATGPARGSRSTRSRPARSSSPSSRPRRCRATSPSRSRRSRRARSPTRRALLERLREVRRDGHAWVRDEYADRDQLRRRADRRCPRRDRRRGPCPRAVVPVPGRRATRTGSRAAVRAAAARIGARLRAGG